MEESDLLKERLQAITEKHRIQEDIRQKKLELDQEKLKLQHLKKKALREQWLLQDSASHNATESCDQQQTRALQLDIHRIEMEVEALEREESMISTNESFILNRLKAVERSSEDIIKEAQDSFVPEPIQVSTVIPDVPESFSPPADTPSEPTTPRKTLFAMEINVSKNLMTGESTVLSTTTVPPEEIDQHSGLKVYDDGRKCVFALNSPEGPRDQSHISELSAHEVQQLLRNATMHRQGQQPHYHQNHSRREQACFYNHHDERDRVAGCELRHQGGHHGDTNGISRSNSLVNGGRANGCPLPRSHDQEVASAYQPQLCYTPANYIPLRDYVCVEEEELYCFKPPSYHSRDRKPLAAAYDDSAHPDRVPSPLYGDDTPYTILNAMETTEPVTAIFMGFQTAQDDSGQGQEFEGSLKAELVIIEDNEDSADDNSMRERKGHTQCGGSSYQTGSSTNGNLAGGDRRAERRVGPGIRKIPKKHKPCCSVC